jgi:hypothetical protein
MDLTRGAAARVFALGFVFPVLAGCSDDPASYSGDAMLLPATLFEALPLATKISRDWNGDAFPTRLGGRFTVMDAQGRALNHSFEFHARFGLQWRRLTVDLISGVPWTQDTPAGEPPPTFRSLGDLDSDSVVGIAIALAGQLNTDDPGSIPPATHYAARLLSVAVWPEPTSTVDPADSVAWRVDFLELDELSNDDPTPVWWSLARFYVDPDDGQFLGDPVLPATGRELYPFP